MQRSEAHRDGEADEARWIAGRLDPFGSVVSSVVPGGFPAYARLLHPAQTSGHGDGTLVRWAEVAAWSGMPLTARSQFHSVALPPVRPALPAPWSSQGPELGRLFRDDANALAGIVRSFTSTPESCLFGLWDGYTSFGIDDGLP